MQTFRHLWETAPSPLPRRLPVSEDLCIQVFVREVFSTEVHCLLSPEETTELSTTAELSKAQGYPTTLIGSSNQNGFSLWYLHTQTPSPYSEHARASHESAWREGKDICLTYNWKYSPMVLQDVVTMYLVLSFEAGIYTFCRLLYSGMHHIRRMFVVFWSGSRSATVVKYLNFTLGCTKTFISECLLTA